MENHLLSSRDMIRGAGQDEASRSEAASGSVLVEAGSVCV